MRIQAYPYIAIRDGVFFPGSTSVLSVARPASTRALDTAARSGDKTIVLLSQRQPSLDNPGLDQLHPVGVKAIIRRVRKNDGGYQVVAESTERVRLRDLSSQPYPLAQVELLEWKEDGAVNRELQAQLQESAARLYELTGDAGAAAAETASSVEGPVEQVHFLASILSLSTSVGMSLLQSERLKDAQRVVLGLLNDRISMLESGESSVWSLGQTSWPEPEEEFLEHGPAAVEMLRERFRELELGSEVRAAIARELGKLERLEPESVDYQNVQIGLEIYSALPWGVYREDDLDLARIEASLDQQLLGLEGVKQELLDLVALLKFSPRTPRLVCLTGAPGTGKMATTKALAQALGRPLASLTLEEGDLESQLYGRVWKSPGSAPGKLFSALREAQSMDPVLVFNQDDLGDAQVRELLNLLAKGPAVRDNYLELPLDLSAALVVVTAHSVMNLSQHLRDRMTVIPLTGYSKEQKVALAQRNLLPDLLEESGLGRGSLEVSDLALEWLIDEHTNESGVTQLSALLSRILLKAARRRLDSGIEVICCDLETMREWVEPSPLSTQRVQPSGTVQAPVMTLRGAQVIGVEALLLPEAEERVFTGPWDQRVEDSMSLAHSLIRVRRRGLGMKLNSHGLHIHLDSASPPVEDLSLAIVLALASAGTGLAVRPGLGVLGQVTLTGQVRGVADLERKLMAARRAGIVHLLIPSANRLPESLSREFTITQVSTLEEALIAAIPELAPKLAIDQEAAVFGGVWN